jgi:endonuclease V-like protein UPF0215 family
MSRKASRNRKPASCIGIEDGPFLPRLLGGSIAPLVAVRLEGPRIVQADFRWITVDGTDGTREAVALLKTISTPKCPILLAGVTFGGFNLIDPRKVQSTLRAPTIVVIGSRPDNRAVKQALAGHVPDWKERWDVIRALGPVRKIRTVRNENPVFYESFGCNARAARELIMSWAMVARVPEPLRVAGLVARGLFPPVQSYRSL